MWTISYHDTIISSNCFFPAYVYSKTELMYKTTHQWLLSRMMYLLFAKFSFVNHSKSASRFSHIIAYLSGGSWTVTSCTLVNQSPPQQQMLICILAFCYFIIPAFRDNHLRHANIRLYTRTRTNVFNLHILWLKWKKCISHFLF